MLPENAKTIDFQDDGRIPNNPNLPLVIYQDALSEARQHAKACQTLFEQNGWGGSWINGIYSYHHYHSTAHEVLGVTGGSAKVQFGGQQGEVLNISKGDVVVIPAGVGHCKISASSDFEVVGAYPIGQDWDLCTGEADERPQVLENIQSVPMPEQDPVYGQSGHLFEAWNGTAET